MLSKTSGVILGTKSFERNFDDVDTVEDVVKQIAGVLNYKPELMIADKGFRGRKEVEGVKVLTPANQNQKITELEKKNFNKSKNALNDIVQLSRYTVWAPLYWAFKV